MLHEDELDIPPEDWLKLKIKEFDQAYNSILHTPTRENGKPYTIEMLKQDQKEIVLTVLDTLKRWLECEDLSSFEPLRLTINGPGGSGKSVVINTIVSIMRNMFGINDVVRVIAPTGTAAFNVGGETFHHLIGMKVTSTSYKPGSMNKDKRLELVSKFKTLLALIIDERSLINSKDLGTTERQIAETIYEGGHMAEKSFGGLPIVILVGDDYQLPGTEEGGLDVLFKRGGSLVTQQGRSALKECANTVMELHGSKRMCDSQQKQKELLGRLRLGEDLSEEDIQKLLSLHLRVMEDIHSKSTVQDIESKAIYLFYTNEKRIRHNIQQLAKYSSSTNPVATIRMNSVHASGGKGIARHFNFSSKAPESSLLCRGAKVAIQNKNFCPLWGLHNGACGIVKELVFSSGKSPNNGDLPSYVVVDFPLYCGPSWDLSHPTVG